MFEVELCNRNGASSVLVYGARNIGVNRILKAPRTARFTVGAGHPLRARLRTAPRVLAKVYDRMADGTRLLKHVGPITGYERQDSAGGLDVTLGSTDASWYLARRYTGILNPTAAARERGLIIQWVVMALQGQSPTDPIVSLGSTLGDYIDSSFTPPPLAVHDPPMIQFDTGIRARTIASTPTIVLTGPTIGKASDIVTACCAGLDGPEWAVYPSEPTIDTWGARLGHLDIAPVLGATKADAIFQFGHGKNNVDSYREILDPGAMATLVAGRGPSWDLIGTDEAAFLLNGTLEDVVNAEGTSQSLVGQLVNDHLAVRKTLRQVITFDVAPDVDPGGAFPLEKRLPRPGVDYDFGDVVTFSAVEKIPVYASDGALLDVTDELVIPATQMRVYAIDESDNDNGQRTTNVTVVAS